MSNDTPIEDRIEEELHHFLDFMKDETDYSGDYKSMISHFTKLMELRQRAEDSERTNETKLMELQQKQIDANRAYDVKLQELEQKNTISKEAWLTVGTHIAGLVVLMNHERAHVIASKAFGLVKKIF